MAEKVNLLINGCDHWIAGESPAMFENTMQELLLKPENITVHTLAIRKFKIKKHKRIYICK